ncbi:universal stress protein [bacterium]|nr:universal stress protein [bacterium]
MKILIATDGSKSARAAQLDLIRAGLPDRLDATVLSVADVWLPPSGRNETNLPEEWTAAVMSAKTRAEEAVEHARKVAVEDAENLKRSYPNWNINAEATADSPGWAIITHAEQSGTDLVVVGSHGTWGLEKLLLGSVSQKVVTHSHGAVRVGRTSPDPDRKEVRLIIGIDGSPGSIVALDTVKSRSWPEQTEVKLIAAIDTRIATVAISDLPEVARWAQTDRQGEGAWLREILKVQCEKLRNVGLRASTVIEEGDPKQILLQYADQWKADCLFVGARGLTRIDRFLLGSVSTAVSARAHCSVEVIHRHQ